MASTLPGAIRAHALSDATLTALIGTKMAFQEIASGTVVPYVEFSLISDPHLPIAFGGSDFNSGQAVFQFDCWAETDTEAAAIEDALMSKLRDMQGTIQGWRFEWSWVRNRRSDRDATTKMYRAQIDMQFDFYEETS